MRSTVDRFEGNATVWKPTFDGNQTQPLHGETA